MWAARGNLRGDPSRKVLLDGRQPAWHPLEDTLAYVISVDGRDRVHWVYLEDEPLVPKRLIKPDAFAHRDPTWSPCGGWVAFAATNEDYDQFADGTEEGTWNIVAVTWSTRYSKHSDKKWWTLTRRSAGATHPAWDSSESGFRATSTSKRRSARRASASSSSGPTRSAPTRVERSCGGFG